MSILRAFALTASLSAGFTAGWAAVTYAFDVVCNAYPADETAMTLESGNTFVAGASYVIKSQLDYAAKFTDVPVTVPPLPGRMQYEFGTMNYRPECSWVDPVTGWRTYLEFDGDCTPAGVTGRRGVR